MSETMPTELGGAGDATTVLKHLRPESRAEDLGPQEQVNFSVFTSQKSLQEAIAEYYHAGQEIGGDGPEAHNYELDELMTIVAEALNKRNETDIELVPTAKGLQAGVKRIIQIERAREQINHDGGFTGALRLGALPPSNKKPVIKSPDDLRREIVDAATTAQELQEAGKELSFDDVETRAGLIAGIQDYYDRHGKDRPITNSRGQRYTAGVLIKLIEEAINTGDFDGVTSKHGLRQAARRAAESLNNSTIIRDTRMTQPEPKKPWWKVW